jgi:hypothetical protein
MTPSHISAEPEPLIIEVDAGSFSSLGRPPDQIWMIRLRRADRSVIVAIGLDRTAAEHLATRIAEIIDADPHNQTAPPPADEAPSPEHPPQNRR